MDTNPGSEFGGVRNDIVSAFVAFRCRNSKINPDFRTGHHERMHNVVAISNPSNLQPSQICERFLQQDDVSVQAESQKDTEVDCFFGKLFVLMGQMNENRGSTRERCSVLQFWRNKAVIGPPKRCFPQIEPGFPVQGVGNMRRHQERQCKFGSENLLSLVQFVTPGQLVSFEENQPRGFADRPVSAEGDMCLTTQK